MYSEEDSKLLCDPDTHEPISFDNQDFFNSKGEKYLKEHGILSFIKQNEIVGLNKKYQKMYDKIAKAYNLIGFLLLRKKYVPMRYDLLSDLKINKGDLVLETSIGTGYNVFLHDKKAKYYGLDISIGMLKACQKDQSTKHPEHYLKLFQGNAEKLPFKDNSFDVVFHVGGINFFNDIQAAVDEMIRVAKPGAQILICDETQKEVDSFYKKMPFISKYFKGAKKIVIPKSYVDPNVKNFKLSLKWKDTMYVMSFNKPK